MFRNTFIAIAALLLAPFAALADAAGVGIGGTAGTYNATASSNAALGHIALHGQVGTFKQSVGTISTASAGLGIGAREVDTVSVAFDGINNGSITIDQQSSVSIEGFGTASSISTIAYEGDGLAVGLAAGVGTTSGDATAAGAFLGVAIGAAAEL